MYDVQAFDADLPVRLPQDIVRSADGSAVTARK